MSSATSAAPSTLSEVVAHPIYPTRLLADCDSALLLFAAGFYGANDGVHFAEARVRNVVAVDTNGARLSVMDRLYPPTWRFVTKDVFDYVDANAATSRWDVVSADPPIELSARVLRLLPALCVMADKAVVVGTMLTAWQQTSVAVPGSWHRTETLMRNDVACWLVWERRDQ